MVTLPKEFVATKIPGYFFNIETKKLFSIKVSGELREMKRIRPNYFNHNLNGYRVSHKGSFRRLEMGYLERLKPANTEIKIAFTY